MHRIAVLLAALVLLAAAAPAVAPGLEVRCTAQVVARAVVALFAGEALDVEALVACNAHGLYGLLNV